DQAGPGRIHENGVRLHHLELGRRDQTARAIAELVVDREHIGRRQQLVLAHPSHSQASRASSVEVLAPRHDAIPNACPTRATFVPRRPRPTTPRRCPSRAPPTVCCQPPFLTEASSTGMLRTTDRISPQVSSGVAEVVDSVPHTTIPCARAASASMEAFTRPVVTSSRRSGSRASLSAVNG